VVNETAKASGHHAGGEAFIRSAGAQPGQQEAGLAGCPFTTPIKNPVIWPGNMSQANYGHSLVRLN